MAFKHLNKRSNVSLATQTGTILQPQDKDREDTGSHCSARTSRAAFHHHVCLARSWTLNWGNWEVVEGLDREVRWKRRLIGSTVCVPSYTISLVNLGMESINHIINIFWNRIKLCLSMMPEIFTRVIKTFSILLCRLCSTDRFLMSILLSFVERFGNLTTSLLFSYIRCFSKRYKISQQLPSFYSLIIKATIILLLHVLVLLLIYFIIFF